MLFKSSIIGSLPRPKHVRDLLAQRDQLSDDEYHTAMDDAIRDAVALQERAGIDEVSDGEWRRASYIGVIAELAHGFELSVSPDGRPWTVVVDTLSPKNPGFIAQEVKFLRSITDKNIKATLPSPGLLGERMWHAEQSSKAYPTRNDFVRDCVPILRREMELLKEHGVTIVQIDDPHLCLFVDETFRSQFDDPEAEAAFDVEMVNELIEGIDGIKIGLHLCRRAGARVRGDESHEGAFDPIIQHLNALHVHHLTLEFTAPGSGDASVLKDLREDFELGLGCVSVHPGHIDAPETIVERIEEALKYVSPERIILNPDCGFAPGSAAEVSLEEVEQKLQNEAMAAKILRERYQESSKKTVVNGLEAATLDRTSL